MPGLIANRRLILTAMSANRNPASLIWIGLFCMLAGVLLIALGAWFGWAPLTTGAILLLVGLVAASHREAGPAAPTSSRGAP